MHYKSIGLTIFGVLLLQLTILKAQQSGSNFGIIPAPNHIEKKAGVFVFNKNTRIDTDDPSNLAVIFLKNHLNNISKLSSGVILDKSKSESKSTIIKIITKGAEKIPAEGYTLNITPTQVTIVGKSAGLFYAVQSFILIKKEFIISLCQLMIRHN